MYKFKDICVGDLFNTKAARWVKVSDKKAVCVMSAVFAVGSIRPIGPDADIVLLWGRLLKEDHEELQGRTSALPG